MKTRDTGERKANPVSVSRLIDSAVDSLGIGCHIHLETLKKNWESIVGITNARNTRPVALDRDILTVAVSSPAWLTQTRFYKATFIETINKYHQHDAVVTDIRFILERS
jgi:predicted nucleic acid-binding Zn ribbon protein